MTAIASMDLAPPEVDEDGLLRYRGRWVALSPKEELAVRPLLGKWSAVVSRQNLIEAVWPEGGVDASALSSLILRLRRRMRPLGLTIETIRARGFLMESVATNRASASTAVGPARGLSKGPKWLTS